MVIVGTERRTLIALELFIGGMAIVGTVGLLGGFWSEGLTVEMLRGSPFTSYLIPALALCFLVGGSSFLAATLLLKRRPSGVPVSLLAGVILVIFEVVEFAVIGLTMFLQPLMFAFGLVVIILAARWQTAQRATWGGMVVTADAAGRNELSSGRPGAGRRRPRQPEKRRS